MSLHVASLSAHGLVAPKTPIVHYRRARLFATATEPAATDSIALAFGSALAEAWRSESTAALAALLPADASVETPMWKCSDRASYESELSGARQFFSALSPPALTVLSHRTLADGRAQVSWMLGVEWPAVWRPRINLLGQSTLTLAPSSSSSGDGAGYVVRRVDESWHQTPSEAFRFQVLPKFRDIASLWASPSAEYLPLQTVDTRKGYELVRVPPMLALQSEWTETGKLLKSEQAPLPPAFAFTGEVQRKGWYNTVSPGFVERALITQNLGGGMAQPAQRRRWFAPLPLRFGDDPTTMPSLLEPSSDPEYKDEIPEEVSGVSVGYVRRPAQLLATRALKQSPANNAVLTTALELAAAVEADGGKVVKSDGKPVVLQISGDLKYGFNDRKELAMCVWLSVPNSLRDERVAVIVDEGAQ